RPRAQPAARPGRRRLGPEVRRHRAGGGVQVPPREDAPGPCAAGRGAVVSRLRSLRARLVLSHVLVALVSGLVTVVVVRLVALQRWDRVSGMPGGARHGAGEGPSGAAGGMAGFRAEFVDSVDRAVLAGVLVGLG